MLWAKAKSSQDWLSGTATDEPEQVAVVVGRSVLVLRKVSNQTKRKRTTTCLPCVIKIDRGRCRHGGGGRPARLDQGGVLAEKLWVKSCRIFELDAHSP